jgi:hypothetical protein
MPDARRIFTPTLVIGNPGGGKTSLLGTFAEYLWETHHKVTLLYSWDGGAIPTGLQKLMHQGLVRFWRARTRSGEGLGIEGAMQATKGYWPALINAETGETSPGVKLVPPVTTRYTVSCTKTGEVLAQLPARHLVAPTYCTPCRTLHQTGELHVTEDVHRTHGFEEVGGVAYDSLTAIGSLVVDHMDEARGAGQIGGEKSAFGGVVISGSVRFGGSNRADIGFAQQRCRQAVHNSQGIPYLVESPVFTALAMEATDEGGLAIVGPKLPGRAATDEASAWFGNVFEMGRAADDAGREHFALYLRPFTDAQGRRHLLKTSASPSGLPAILVDPIEQPWAQANLGVVFRLLDDDLRRALAEKSVAGAPGLAGTPTEYGEAFQVTTAPPPASGELPALVAAAPGVAPPAAPTPPAPAPINNTAPVTVRKRRAEPLVVSSAEPVGPAGGTPYEAAVASPVAVAAGGPPPPPGKPPARLPNS